MHKLIVNGTKSSEDLKNYKHSFQNRKDPKNLKDTIRMISHIKTILSEEKRNKDPIIGQQFCLAPLSASLIISSNNCKTGVNVVV